MEHSRRTKRSHKNDRIKAERFLALFRGRMAADITTKEIEDFRAAMGAERTVATVNHYLKFLKAVFNRAVRQGRLRSNPVTPMRLQREHNARNRCLSVEEEARLMAACRLACGRLSRLQCTPACAKASSERSGGPMWTSRRRRSVSPATRRATVGGWR